ncbi:TolC family protein [Bdellovibrionota bacterium FG-2]
MRTRLKLKWIRMFTATLVIFAVGCVAFGSHAAKAQEESQETLQNLIEEALKNRPALEAVKYEAIAKEAEIGPRGSYDDPMLGYSALNYPSDTLSPGELGMTGNEFSITQKIPFPGKLSKLRNAARHEYTAKSAGYSQKKLELIKEVRVAYFELFLAYKKKDIVTEQVSLMGQLISITRSKYTLGKAQQAELLALQLEEGNLRDELLTAEKKIRVKAADLNQAVGRPSETALGRPELPPKPSFDFSVLSEESLLEKMHIKNPSLRAMQSELAASDSKLSFAKWNCLPDFEFRVAYMKRQPSPGDRGVDLISGGVSLSIPLWAFSKQSEEVRSASAEKVRSEKLLDEERLHLNHQVKTMYADLEESDKRMRLYDGGLVPLARQAVLSAKSSYLTGKLEYVAVVNLIRNRFQIEFAYNEALVSYQSRIAEFEALIGESLGAKP